MIPIQNIKDFENEQYKEALNFFAKIIEADPTNNTVFYLYFKNRKDERPIDILKSLKWGEDNKALPITKDELFQAIKELHKRMHSEIET